MINGNLGASFYHLFHSTPVAELPRLRCPMRGSKKFCQRGSNCDNVFFLFVCFLVDEGRIDPNTTISGPTSARQQGPTLNAGLVAL